MLNFYKQNEKLIAIVPIFIVGLLWTGYNFLVFEVTRGQRIEVLETIPHSSEQETSEQLSFSEIDKVLLTKVFGLQYHQEKEIAKQALLQEEEVHKESEAQQEKKSLEEINITKVNLSNSGYKLLGIINEKGRGAAFIYDPKQRKNIIVREHINAGIEIVSMGKRWVKLEINGKKGYLELEGTGRE